MFELAKPSLLVMLKTQTVNGTTVENKRETLP